jgi:UDP-N-acetylglucosamine 1-carboxyvinyltransferase
MYQFVIRGGSSLQGSIQTYGSKNAAMPLLAATLLTTQPVQLKNIPPILDTTRLLHILQSIGAQVEQKDTSVTVTAKTLTTAHMPTDTIGLLRGSILLLGALLGRERQVTLPLPGGDIIGARPIDAHLDAFRQLGAVVKEDTRIVSIDGRKMKAGTVTLKEFSVTATENLLLVAATLSGTTTLYTAACEPHVVALANLLNKMGAKITGAGTHTITIKGVKKLKGATFTNIPDMLEAGSFILLGAVTNSEIEVLDVPFEDLRLFFKKLDEIGIKYTYNPKKKSVKVLKSTLKAFKMQSLPHPGIPTDLQAPFAVVATQAQGSSLIHDPLYEGRLKHIAELQKMGATAVICDPHRVIVTGPTVLHGNQIPSLDLRSGATLLMAGLVAEGETVIENADLIERGYANIVERLQALGADIQKRDDGAHT